MTRSLAELLRRADARGATVAAFTTHARTTPSATREAFAEQVAALADNPAAIVVRTCHRVELYTVVRSLRDCAPDVSCTGLVCYEDVDAVRHLISVACGLDSAVLGENQVLHQLREQFAARHAAGAIDPVLDRLFQAALRAGRTAHAWFGGRPRSLADVALERIAATAGIDAPVLVVGAGIMGRLTARAAVHRGLQVLVASRTRSRAEALARDVGGRVVPFTPQRPLPPVCGVVVVLSGPWPLPRGAWGGLAASGATVVDLSSPPSIHEELQRELGDHLVSVDDLAWGEEERLDAGLRHKLDRLVSESGHDYCRWLRARETLPTIQAISLSAEDRRHDELAWLFRRMPDIDEREQALIEQMTKRLVASLLHAPRTALNEDADGSLSEAAVALFGLPEQEPRKSSTSGTPAGRNGRRHSPRREPQTIDRRGVKSGS